ncbi:MAG TPA: M20/M25/M40 family metallo-hydrolase [Gemmatimonadales bacterium]
MRSLPALFWLATLPGLAPAQGNNQALYDSAFVAWQDGDYVRALEGFDRLLAAAGGGRFLEPIALVTGELYHTATFAPDGRVPQWSPDGRFASFEIGSATARRTQVLRFEGGAFRPVALLPGFALVFPRAGLRAAYLDSEGVVVRDLGSERRATMALPGLAPRALVYGEGDALYLVAGDRTTTDIYVLAPGGTPRALTRGPGVKGVPLIGRGAIAYTAGNEQVIVHSLATGRTRVLPGSAPAVSSDGSTLVFLSRSLDTNTVNLLALADTGPPRVLVRTRDRLTAPSLSADGRRVVYQRMPREDWELYRVDADGGNELRLTREIQHDVLPRFIGPDRILAMIGEARHRRSYLYDAVTGARTRLFHNNTVRTVAPEYSWAPSPDGTRVLIVADRDGDTVSPERGVYLVDLTRRVTIPELRARIAASLAGERRLRETAERTFAPFRDAVRAAVADVSVTRIYGYARDLFEFDSKHITQPGNRLAIDYLVRTLASFGYEPELQWFEPRPGIRTANVIATLRGTTNPDAVYVVSSHFDSVQPGPGADDNTSGTTALLEAARVLARRPQTATIKFAFFTGEEAGLLGSREFVRRARAAGERISGALNNDMLGWMNDQRLDNTIRYSNAWIRDVQHGAALLFTDLITYDSRYYQSTDAAAYYEAYGDIVGGIGSYPILGNPHYHQPHDVLETISQRLVAEVSKTTVATLVVLASSPTLPPSAR